MKKIVTMLIAVLGLCAFSSSFDNDGSAFEVSSNSTAWEVKTAGTSLIRAYNQSSETEIIINVSNLLPNSPKCLSNKRIKDIKITLDIRKIAQKGDSNWAKSYEKTRIRFSSPQGSQECRIYGSNLMKNNLKVSVGSTVNIGTLEFLAPFTCDDFLSSSMQIYGMSANGRPLPTLDITIKGRN